MGMLIRDQRKNVMQGFMEKAGGTTTVSVTSGTPYVFAPALSGNTSRLYVVRATADIRIACHNAAYVFDPTENPPLFAFEEKPFELNADQGHLRITMQAISATAIVYISEVDDSA